MSEIVTAAKFISVNEARVAAGLLESAEIWCQIAEEHFVSAAGHPSPLGGGVRLQVREEDLAGAQELLSAEIEGTPESQPKLKPQTQCPHCDSKDLRVVRAEEKESETFLGLRIGRSYDEDHWHCSHVRRTLGGRRGLKPGEVRPLRGSRASAGSRSPRAALIG
jgi:hypothetical protein